jgi:hypothetical protein
MRVSSRLTQMHQRQQSAEPQQCEHVNHVGGGRSDVMANTRVRPVSGIARLLHVTTRSLDSDRCHRDGMFAADVYGIR